MKKVFFVLILAIFMVLMGVSAFALMIGINDGYLAVEREINPSLFVYDGFISLGQGTVYIGLPNELGLGYKFQDIVNLASSKSGIKSGTIGLGAITYLLSGYSSFESYFGFYLGPALILKADLSNFRLLSYLSIGPKIESSFGLYNSGLLYSISISYGIYGGL